jgi:hypothetical protein
MRRLAYNLEPLCLSFGPALLFAGVALFCVDQSIRDPYQRERVLRDPKLPWYVLGWIFAPASVAAAFFRAGFQMARIRLSDTEVDAARIRLRWDVDPPQGVIRARWERWFDWMEGFNEKGSLSRAFLSTVGGIFFGWFAALGLLFGLWFVGKAATLPLLPRDPGPFPMRPSALWRPPDIGPPAFPPDLLRPGKEG